MATTCRAFTLSTRLQKRLDALRLPPGQHLIQTYLPSPAQAAESEFQLDELGLLPEEYSGLLSFIGVRKPVKTFAEFKLIITTNLKTAAAVTRFNAELRKAKTRSRGKVREVAPLPTNGVPSQSRLVDALLTFAIDTLEERAANGERTGSKDGHAGQTQDKPSNRKARRAVAA